MFKWAIIFALLAALAAIAGFSGLAGAAAGVAKLLFYTALTICVILLLVAFAIYWKVARPLLRALNHERSHADTRHHRY